MRGYWSKTHARDHRFGRAWLLESPNGPCTGPERPVGRSARPGSKSLSDHTCRNSMAELDAATHRRWHGDCSMGECV